MAEKQMKNRDIKAREKTALNIKQAEIEKTIAENQKKFNLEQMKETLEQLRLEFGFNGDRMNEIQDAIKNIEQNKNDVDNITEGLALFDKLQGYKQMLFQQTLRQRKLENLFIPQIKEEIRMLEEDGTYYPKNYPQQR